MQENLQETCLEMIRKHDADLAHLEAAALEDRINTLVNAMKEKVLPVRINQDEASLEPPVFMGMLELVLLTTFDLERTTTILYIYIYIL